LITDEAGGAIEGVTAWCYSVNYADRESLFEPKVVEARTVTDSAGGFELGPLTDVESEKTTRHLVFEHRDYATGWLSFHGASSADPDALKLILLEPETFAARVVDSHGGPIANVLVEAELQVMPDNVGYISYFDLTKLNGLAVYTDSQGYFAFETISHKTRLHIRARHDDYALYHSRTEYPADLYPFAPGRQNVLITLQPGTHIEGYLALNGQRYEKKDLLVSARSGERFGWAFTDEHGNFEVRNLDAGTYVLAIDGKQLKDLGLACRPVENVQVAAGDPKTGIRLNLQMGLPVTVEVVDKNTEAGLAEQSVTVTAASDATIVVASAKTDERGRCTVRLPGGVYTLTVQGWKNGRLHQFSEQFAVEPNLADLSVRIAVTPRPFIHGWLIDPDGNPVQGTVLLGHDKPTKTDEDGGFVIPEPWWRPGGIFVGYALDLDKGLGRGFLWQKTDEANDLEIVLDRLATVVGRLVDTNGTGVGELTPRLDILLGHGMSTGAANHLWNVTIDPDGQYRFEGVPVGLTMSVFAEIPGYQGHSDALELEPGSTVEVGEVVLRPLHGFEDGQADWTGILSGHVLNENNEPVVGLKVGTSVGLDSFDDITDTEGRYTLTGLPKGKTIRVGLYAPGYGHCYSEVVVDGNDFDLKIFPQGWDLLDKPAPGLFVEKWVNSEPVSLEQYGGKVVLLQVGILLPNYLAQFERIEGLLEKYGDKGLEVVAIHQPLEADWAGKVTEEDLVAFIEKHNIRFPFGIDREQGSYSGVTYKLYSVKATPALYLVDKQGILRISPTRDNQDEWIRHLLAE
jgi:hypothetical protein